MTRKEVTLEVASFLDSEHATRVPELSREECQKLATAFLSIAYDDLGKAPHLLDGQDMHGAFGHVLPGWLKRKDPRAPLIAPFLHALVDYLEESHVMPNAFEVRAAIESTRDEFEETVRTGHNPHHGHSHGPKQETVVHTAPKLGRNDPCFCGSGKKFKKCCGKA